MTTRTKYTNEGHSAKVPHGRAIGIVFFGGLVIGGIVTFLAVAGRTQAIVEQRRAMDAERKAHGEVLPAPAPSEATQSDGASPSAK